LQRLSDVLLEKGDYEAARSVAERCVLAERKILAQSPTPSISMTEPDLALAQKDFERAETLFREKADYWGNKVPLPDNIDVTRYFFHLARAQEEQNRFTDALATLERACDVARLDFGNEHPRVAKAERKLQRVRDLTSV
jgi:tetratricopeptide (TPR) repeat protein